MTKARAPQRRTIAIHCSGCRALIYRYRKGGTGGLVKCYVDRIAEDLTAGDLRCPGCGQAFARLIEIAGKPAHKIIGGKVFTRGMRRRSRPRCSREYSTAHRYVEGCHGPCDRRCRQR